eukprot:jgi/Ulvmu1/6621/UM003_0258.1
MAGVEAVRVLAVLDEAVEGLRFLSYLTPTALMSADQLVSVLGQNLADTMLRFKGALTLKTSKEEAFHPELIKATMDVWRQMKKSDAVEAKLTTLHCDRPDSMLHVINLFKELRDVAHKRLTTTVEEDRRAQEHFEDVKLREEKAMSEQQQLQQKLKLDRIQWQKQAHLVRAQEEALVTNLNAMRTSHAATLHQLRSENQSLQQAFDAEYEEARTRLLADVAALEAELAGMHAAHGEAEEATRKRKKKAEQEVDMAVREYDAEIVERHAEVEREEAALQGLQARMAVLSEELQSMQSARHAHEEDLARQERERQRALVAAFTRNRASRVIQKAWAAYLVAKKKAASSKGKEKGKGKK